MTKWALSQGCKDFFFNICKPINVIHHINNLKDKNGMIISISSVQLLSRVQLFVTA